MFECPDPKGDHLCVLVHGLWGNPTHFTYIVSAIRKRFPGIILLLCRRNSGNFTYDGIETGGERVTREIELALEECARRGVEVKKLSVVGYSLGGLVARYAVGLLYSRGWFEKLKPVNFTTFATPHLGVRTPLLGWHNHLWNVLSARVLSVSGRQLFLIDNFRNTNRPLLSLMADKDSIFYKGLSLFANKILYANIINDSATCLYTSAISHVDPFADLSSVSVNFVPGYAPVVVDPFSPVSLRLSPAEVPAFVRGQTHAMRSMARRLPTLLLYLLFIPILIVAFLSTVAFQTVSSKRRIRLHENEEGEREGYHYYRKLQLLLVEEVQERLEGVVEDIYKMQEAEHLPREMEVSSEFRDKRGVRGNDQGDADAWIGDIDAGGAQIGEDETRGLLPESREAGERERGTPSGPGNIYASVQDDTVGGNDFIDHNSGNERESEAASDATSSTTSSSSSSFTSPKHQSEAASTCTSTPISPETPPHLPEFPTLALAPSQFEMISNLDALSWRKFPVWIHDDPRAHAAMIVRDARRAEWQEGSVVIKHWLEEEFVL